MDGGHGIDGGPAVDAGRDAGHPADANAPDAGDRCPAAVVPSAFDCAAEDPTIAFGDPITAPPMEWTFVGFDDAFCMDGSTTGVAVNLNPASDRVMIFMEGGGACFDFLSCAGVAGQNGFDAGDLAGVPTRGILDRTDPDNPVRDYNFVFVPYCTGDVHAGTNPVGFGRRKQVGYRNVTAYLSRLVPTFSSASMVLLAGSSAGGLGTLINLEQVQRAFDCVPVHVLDDAGPVMSDEYLKPCLQAKVRDLWGLDAIIPADCPQCTCMDGGGMVSIYPYLAQRFPNRRIGLVSATGDATFRSFYGYGYSPQCNLPAGMSVADYQAGLEDVRARMSAFPTFHSYLVDGTRHTFTGTTLSSTTVGGTALSTWVQELIDGDAAWADVGP